MNHALAKDSVFCKPESRVGDQSFSLLLEQRESDMIHVTRLAANEGIFRNKDQRINGEPIDYILTLKNPYNLFDYRK